MAGKVRQMKWRKSLRIPAMCAVIVFTTFMILLSCIAEAAEEKTLFGKWAFSHDPASAVLTLNEDGSGSYFQTDIFWSEENGTLFLADAQGSGFKLKFDLTGDSMTVYLPSLYERISEIGEEGDVIGTWKATGDNQSSYVFTENGKFLEDGIFTGDYLFDAENGTVTLKYVGGFADTLIYVSFFEGKLTVEYPWTLVQMK